MDVGVDTGVITDLRITPAAAVASRACVELHVRPFICRNIDTPFTWLHNRTFIRCHKLGHCTAHLNYHSLLVLFTQ